MYKCNPEYASKTAIHLAEESIKSTEMWIEPKVVIDFIEEIYNYLTTGEKPQE